MFTNDITDCTSEVAARVERRVLREVAERLRQRAHVSRPDEVERARARGFRRRGARDSYAATAAQGSRSSSTRTPATAACGTQVAVVFAYWLCPDGTPQASVKHTQLNLQAIAFGVGRPRTAAARSSTGSTWRCRRPAADDPAELLPDPAEHRGVERRPLPVGSRGRADLCPFMTGGVHVRGSERRRRASAVADLPRQHPRAVHGGRLQRLELPRLVAEEAAR